MKVFSLSNRFYYREFPDLKNIILHNLRVYNGVSGTTPLERQVGMQIGSYLFAYDFGYKIIFLYKKLQIG